VTALCFAVLTVSALAKDEWIQVRSKNFFLVGNAPEKDIRKVATKLEQFRETFRLIFKGVSVTSAVPTNVVVFKSNSAYRPFKPRRADGKPDDGVAGYFQSADDVNYITLSTEGADTDYTTIFHEYVHFIVNTNFGKSDVPTWFNEGLAEYYSTFQIEDDQKIKLGLPESNHLLLLQENKLMPLSTLFNVSNRALHQTGGHSRTIFYAESWALIHYLIQGGKGEGLGKFLDALIKDVPPEKAFKDTFQMDYAAMEKELKQYVGKHTFNYVIYTTNNKLNFDTEMQASPLDESESSAYLGDLLYHTHRVDDAEPFLKTALTGKPDSVMANTALGMVKIQQRKYNDAKNYLDKAVTLDPKNHMALYRYAYLLSREDQDEFGYADKVSPERLTKMRDLLKKAIAAKPSFTESYELLAYINEVSGENLDESISLMTTALKYQPGNQKYALRIAGIYGRQQKFAEARKIAEKIAATADDDEIRTHAEQLAEQAKRNEESFAKYQEARKQAESGGYTRPNGNSGGGGGRPVLVKRIEEQLTPEEIERRQQAAMLRSINSNIRKPADGEKRVVGNIAKISCAGGKVVYSVKSDAETFTLSSRDFQQLELNAFTSMNGVQVGCNGDFGNVLAVLTYKSSADVKAANRGELVAIDFVPPNFKLMDDVNDEIDLTQAVEASPPPPARIDPPDSSPTPAAAQPEPDLEKQRREAIMNAVRENLRKPAEGEKREMGFIEKSECTTKGSFFFFKTPSQVLKLSADPNKQPVIRSFTRDSENLEIGCGMKPVEIPVVFVYKPTTDGKAKSVGEILSIEFVPKSFVFEN
jgi:tetratricopeptide (TPR) repeat protein